MTNPFFSIIIPTYNSSATLEYTLKSICDQDFDKKELEILVIDGGSEDSTIEIAKRYGANIYYNEHRLPEYAKLIGVERANGRYIIRMDSDEEFSYSTQLAEKRDFFEKHPDIQVLISNLYIYGRRELCGIAASYMNILGDPFSYFVYRTNGDKCRTYKKHILYQNGKTIVMSFTQRDMMPLADSGTCAYSLQYIKQKYPNEYNTVEFTCSTFYRLIYDTGKCGCIKGDNIRHNCRSDFLTYIRKLRFRVVNNLFSREESGFSSNISKIKRYRTVLFCIYALLIPIPILDSLRLALKYKDITFMLHFVYLYYVCICIFVSCCKYLSGKIDRMRSYG